jgi:hypothetical protein
MDLYADVHYPKELIEHHLVGGLRMQVRIFQSHEPRFEDGGGEWGIVDGMRFIKHKEWITDELDCFKQYRSYKP